MYLIVVFSSLLNFLILSLFGRFLGRDGIFILSMFLMGLTFIFSGFAFFEVCIYNSNCIIDLFSWLNLGFLHVTWGFLFDTLTCVMLCVITFISLLVHLYSFDYMRHDTHLIRFISYLSLFTFFMIILVTSPNFLQFFLGWEGVGVTSYLLINFWFTRMQANKSAIKAILVNKIGDIALLIALCLIFIFFKSLDFAVIFSLLPLFSSFSFNFLFIDIDVYTLICLFLFIGVVAKSAQLGLHMWLPDAMEGPTPVSALIHAATMVTAGVFLLLRCSILFNYSIIMLGIVTIVGALTAIVAAMIGISQIDIKKIIAYSTCSQLGYMVFSCGLSNYSASLFHLTNHAFFKALLFLSAGVIIHALQDEQDLRRMGGLVNILPFTYCVMLIGTFAIIGFPFLSGFYSKDVILELNFVNLVYKWEAWFSFFIGLFTAFFTAMYSFKLVILVFFKRFKFSSVKVFLIEEASLFLAIPLFVLSIFSMFSGFFFKDAFVGFGSIFFNNSVIGNSNLLYSEFLFDSIKEYVFQSFVSTELWRVASETNLNLPIDLGNYDWLIRVLYGSFDDGFTGLNYGSTIPHPAFWNVLGWNVDLSLMREPLYLRFSVYFYFINLYVKFLPLIFTFSGIFVICFFYFKVYGHVLKAYDFDIIYPYHDSVGFFYFSYKKFYIDFLVNYILVKFIFKISYSDTFLLIDRGFLESFGPKNISKFIILFSNNLKNFQTGLFVHYLHYIFSFLILFVFIMFFNLTWSFNILIFFIVGLVLFFDFNGIDKNSD